MHPTSPSSMLDCRVHDSGKQHCCTIRQGCFIGCPECDNESGRRQVDLCGLGKQQTLTDPKYWSVNRDATPGSVNDIYKHNPCAAIPLFLGLVMCS